MAKKIRMSEKHLIAGSALPPLKKDTLRIYNMRFCPFGHRAMLTLLMKGIPHEVVHVNTKNKPEWFLEKTLKGLVPVLEINDQIIYESIICCEYLDEVYKENPLAAKTPYERAQDKMLTDFLGSKLVPAFYALRRARDDGEKRETYLKCVDTIENVLKKRATPYFGGDKPGLADIYVWPFFERIEGFRLFDGGFPSDRFPLLAAWMSKMLEVPAVKSFLLTNKQHDEFMKYYGSATPLFDELL